MFVKKSANFAGNKAREELISSAKICWRAKDNFVYRSITTITIAQWIDNNIFKVSPFLRGTGINLIYFLERFSNLKNKLGSYLNLSRIFFFQREKRDLIREVVKYLPFKNCSLVASPLCGDIELC